MKYTLVLLAAGVLCLTGAGETPEAPAAPAAPYFDAEPLCGGDGEVVGVQIRTNAPAYVALTWPKNICAARAT